jgi:hypothetical protein
MEPMKPLWILAAAALLACSGVQAQQMQTPPAKQAGKKPPKLGASKSDGRGRSVANDQQQVQSDKFQMRQDKANKDDKSYKKHQQQMQQDQDQVNRDNSRR